MDREPGPPHYSEQGHRPYSLAFGTLLPNAAFYVTKLLLQEEPSLRLATLQSVQLRQAGSSVHMA